MHRIIAITITIIEKLQQQHVWVDSVSTSTPSRPHRRLLTPSMAYPTASSGISLFQSRYVGSCRRHGHQPNLSILSSLSKAAIRESRGELCILELELDGFTKSEIPVLLEVLAVAGLDGIDAVDVLQELSSFWIDVNDVVSLIRAVEGKLRVLDIRDWLFWKDALRDIFRGGLACHTLNLRFAPIVKLNLSGNFLQLHTLNLDFSVSLSSFRINCFSCMPNLMKLSMCGTCVSNLWMVSAALSKLPALLELRFQNCLCCYNTGACTTLFGDDDIHLEHEKLPQCCKGFYSSLHPLSTIRDSVVNINPYYSLSNEPQFHLPSDGEAYVTQESPERTRSGSLDSDVVFTNYQHNVGSWIDRSSDTNFDFNEDANEGSSINQIEPFSVLGYDSPIPTHNQLFEDVPHSEINSSDTQSDNSGAEFIEEWIHEDQNIPSSINKYRNLSPVNQATYGLASSGSQFCTELQSPPMLEPSHASKQFVSHHPSPICFEKYYREYMIASLPQLKVLDNLLIRKSEREKANIVFKKHFELLPYRRPFRESITEVLNNRELGICTLPKRTSYLKQSYSSRESVHLFSRSLSSAKTSSSPWPHMYSLSKFKSISRDETKIFCPRQFEYHPSDPALMAFGTLDGEVVVLNHESGKFVGSVPSSGAFNSILGLCWLKKHPSKLIAGSDNGSLKLYDVCQMSPVFSDGYHIQDRASSFDEFEHLTSVHVNSTDELFLASGFSKHVALYDIGSGRRLQVFKDLHHEHINVVKFAHHSPSIFATASFDQDVKMWDLRKGVSSPCYTVSSPRGNVMACFSPDDHYLLSSAVDNEVRQHLAVDGRLHMAFDISSTGSAQNYTRSYYMNGRDYIISGSSEENVVRVCCSQTGRRLRDISMETRGLRNSMFVQSLRGDPFRVFHMSVLAAYLRPSSRSEIIRVNMLSSGDGDVHDNLCIRSLRPSLHMGG